MLRILKLEQRSKAGKKEAWPIVQSFKYTLLHQNGKAFLLLSRRVTWLVDGGLLFVFQGLEVVIGALVHLTAELLLIKQSVMLLECYRQ